MFERTSDSRRARWRTSRPPRADAHWILDGADVALLPLLHAAFAPRERHFGRRVMVHVLNNVQNGLLPRRTAATARSRATRSRRSASTR
jgi:hypothetical protein